MKKLTFQHIKQLLCEYEKHYDTIIQRGFLTISRICYPIMTCYNKHQGLIPTDYEINFYDLMNDKHKEFLSKYRLRINTIEIEHYYRGPKFTQWRMKIKGFKHSGGYWPLDFEEHVQIYFTRDNKIHNIERILDAPSWYTSFDRMLSIAMIILYENKLTNIILNNIYDAIKTKLNGANQILEELQNEIGILDIVKLER